MGIFTTAQPEYAEYGVATFPLDISGANKKPMIRNPQKIGRPASAKLAASPRFQAADGIGFWAGKHSNITVVDVDSPDKAVRDAVIARHGDPGIIVQNKVSGKWHLYYRHNGEVRRTRRRNGRSYYRDNVPIDLLGSGLVVAPPSRSDARAYEIVSGSLSDLEKLEPAEKLIDWFDAPYGSHEAGRLSATQGERIGQGARHTELLLFLCRQAHHCDDLDALIDVANGFVADKIDREAGHPFTDAEVVATARSVWQWTIDGRNFVGRGRSLVLKHETMDAVVQLGSDVHFLFCLLKRHNWSREHFAIANAMADHMPGGAWTLRRLQNARNALISAGFARQIRNGSQFRGAALYGWTSEAG